MKSRPDDLAQETIRKVANDENMAAIRGNTRVADIYFGEFMRVFDHLYSRYIVEKMKNAGKSDPDAGYLKDDAKDWVPANFSKGRKDLRRLNRLKTEYSEDDLPLDPDFATQLLHWKRQCPPSSGEWVFANPATSLPNYASEIKRTI